MKTRSAGGLPRDSHMAHLDELLAKVADSELRGQLQAEVSALKSRTRFGLVTSATSQRFFSSATRTAYGSAIRSLATP